MVAFRTITLSLIFDCRSTRGIPADHHVHGYSSRTLRSQISETDLASCAALTKMLLHDSSRFTINPEDHRVWRR